MSSRLFVVILITAFTIVVVDVLMAAISILLKLDEGVRRLAILYFLLVEALALSATLWRLQGLSKVRRVTVIS